jgi:hypothetical protein
MFDARLCRFHPVKASLEQDWQRNSAITYYDPSFGKYFQGNIPAEFRIGGAIHFAHPACA